MKPKSALKSTEFWIVLAILAIANAFPIILQRHPDSEILQTVALVVAGIVDMMVGLGYLISRTKLKTNGGGNGGYISLEVLLSLILALSLGALIFSGCSIKETWVKASRANYDFVAPAYAKYCEDDPGLSDIQKKLRRAKVLSWNARIKEWEKTLED